MYESKLVSRRDSVADAYKLLNKCCSLIGKASMTEIQAIIKPPNTVAKSIAVQAITDAHKSRKTHGSFSKALWLARKAIKSELDNELDRGA